jgi:hypothetical protein
LLRKKKTTFKGLQFSRKREVKEQCPDPSVEGN